MKYPLETSARSDEISACWQRLEKLFWQELELNTLNGVQHLVQRDELQAMVEESMDEAHTFDAVADRIKANLPSPTDLNVEIKIACEAYNVAVARAMYSQAKLRLPRELRDMVYQYLTGEEVKICIDPDHDDLVVHCEHCEHSDYDRAPYFPARPRTKDDALCAAHFWRDDILGPSVALEMTESWYRNSKFTVATHKSPWNPPYFKDPFELKVDTILSTDRFGLGLEPAKLIGNFTREFHIWQGCLENRDWILGTTESIQELSRLRYKAQICLCLYFDDWTDYLMYAFDYCRMLVRFMSVFYDALLRLRKAKYIVTVRIGNQNLIRERTLKEMIDVLQYWEQKLEDGMTE